MEQCKKKLSLHNYYCYYVFNKKQCFYVKMPKEKLMKIQRKARHNKLVKRASSHTKVSPKLVNLD